MAVFTVGIVDVSIGTMRIISLTRGLKTLSALSVYFEGLIWIIAINQVMVLFTIVRRKQLLAVTALIRQHNPQAIYTVENVRFASASGPEMTKTKHPLARQRYYSLRT